MYQNRCKAVLVVCAIAFLASVHLHGQNISVFTGQYGNNRTGANPDEPYLNSSLVNVASFGKVGTLHVDGLVFAQPLYVEGVKIGTSSHNVVYIATQHNSIYAFDADSLGLLWRVSLGTSVPATIGVLGACPISYYTGPELGILSTPVIDPSTNTLYAVSATPNPAGGGYIHRLFALDSTTGALKFGSPVTISAAVPSAGAPDAVNGVITLDHFKLIQRAALLLSGGVVTVGLGGCGPDPFPYHGWLLGYSASTLAQVFTFMPTPETEGGAIWQSGRGPVADSHGNIYVETGNASPSETTDVGDSVVRLNSAGQMTGVFEPSGRVTLDDEDLDLGASGPILAPDTGLLIAGGKQGNFYLLNPSSLSPNGLALQTISPGTQCSSGSCGGIRSVAYWRAPSGGMLYVWAATDVLRALKYVNGSFQPSTTNPLTSGYPGGILAVSSAWGASNAILWAMASVPGDTTNNILHAFDAATLTELWNSNQNSARDSIGYSHYSAQFTVASARVFLPDTSNGTVAVYAPLVPAPTPQCPSSSAVESISYSQTVTATGGVTPYRYFYVISGSLPTGLTQTGASITGSPTKPGTFSFTEEVVDGRNSASGTATAACSITVAPAISGIVYTDVNGNGKYDPGVDTPLSGVTITLRGNGVDVTTKSASDGSYYFVNNYAQGTYRLRAPSTAGNNQTPDTPDRIIIAVTPGVNYPGNDFGYHPPS